MRMSGGRRPAIASYNLRGIAAMTAASLLFAGNDACLKLVSKALPATELVAIRNTLAACLLVIYGLATGEMLPWRARMERAIFWRTFGEIGIIIFYLFALFRIPIGLAASILQFGPLAMTAGAAIFLKESVGWRRWTATAVGLVGVLLMIGPGTQGLSPAAWMAVVALLFMTLRELATRGVPRDVPATQIALVSVVAVAAIALALTPVEGYVTPAGWHLFYLSISAACVVMAFLLIIYAMRTGEVGVVAPFRYSYAVGSLLLGYFIWSETPTPIAFAGLVIVVASGLYVLHREQARR
ncbi:MAG: DMT family transporter [Hyphomicrobiaceae bacterium]|nr:MAG: DMT family transporter [Hyphomicrobiaceae bacterium]